MGLINLAINKDSLNNKAFYLANADKSIISVINNIEKKSPHSTRHTFATMLQAKGAKPEDLIRVIGHSDYKTTTENYIHQNIDTLSEMIEMIDIE